MKVCIVYYSHSGHTNKVVEKVLQRLRSQGQDVACFQLETVEPLNLRSEMAQIKDMPNISAFQYIIFGTPVHGGRMSAPMRCYLDENPSFLHMSAAVLVTHFFRKGWGAVQTIQEMRNLVVEKGAKYLGAINIKWFSLVRTKAIRDAVETLVGYFDIDKQ